ncbi:MAG TPA: iron ABC transporter permease [Desulfobacteraceae bacterium]|nr:iron ABC transporter permease [Desulfobacteraceae bacterium]
MLFQSHSSLSRRLLFIVPLLGLILLLSMVASLLEGSSGLGIADVLASFSGGGGKAAVVQTILWRIRLPRAVLAAAVGATLSLGGLVFQARLGNPLAEPYILGISGGAAVGAILGMFFGLAMFPGVTLLAFAGAMLVMATVLLLARTRGGGRSDFLLLAGVMLNAFCSACIMFLLSLSRGSQVQHILFWLMGDLSMAEPGRLWLLLPLPACFFLILILARPMNLLLTGQESAAALGVHVQRLTWVLLGTTSFMVSLVVSQSGLVGFVGLLVPHFFRLLLGPDHRILVPACILGGGAYLVLCDLLARALPASGEMPVGVITALVGAPLFVFLLWRSRT